MDLVSWSSVKTLSEGTLPWGLTKRSCSRAAPFPEKLGLNFWCCTSSAVLAEHSWIPGLRMGMGLSHQHGTSMAELDITYTSRENNQYIYSVVILITEKNRKLNKISVSVCTRFEKFYVTQGCGNNTRIFDPSPSFLVVFNLFHPGKCPRPCLTGLGAGWKRP